MVELVLLAAQVASAPGEPPVRIVHEGADCVLADRHPAIEARFDPPHEIVRAHVRFRGLRAAQWYVAEMAESGGVYRAALPRPRLGFGAIEYAIEAFSVGLVEVRTEIFRPFVVIDESACPGDVIAPVVDSATPVETESERNASAPQPEAAGGGIGGATVAGIGAGVGALAALAVGGGNGERALDAGPLSIVVLPFGTAIVNLTALDFAARNGEPGRPHSWTFGDGAGGSGETASHIYTRPGDFQVSLTIAGEAGPRSATTTVTAGSVDGTWIQETPFADGTFVTFRLIQTGTALSGTWIFDASAIGGGTDEGAALGSLQAPRRALIERADTCIQRFQAVDIAPNLQRMSGGLTIGEGCPLGAETATFAVFNRVGTAGN